MATGTRPTYRDDVSTRDGDAHDVDRPMITEDLEQPIKNPSGKERDNDTAIIEQAKDEFKEDQDWESEFRNLYVIDVKFANADADNGWQWPDDLRRDREINKRPALTINKVGPQCRLVTNDARQNKPSIKIKPTGKESSFAAAQVYEGIVRHIEYASVAQSIYDDATESQVEGGIGYWRVITEYEDDETFNQVLKIAPVQSHLGVLLDRNIKMKDGSDARRGFIFEDVARKRFDRQYPDVQIPPGTSALNESDGWVRTDYVRVAEYYRIVEERDELIYIEEGSESATFRLSEMPDRWHSQLAKAEKDPTIVVKRRPIMRKQLEWYKIAGNTIVARRKLPGIYIPIVRVVGKERVIDGKLERKGLTRDLKDPQRMYNYNSSAEVEYGALQTKSPWIGPRAAFEGNEVAWNNANRSNAAYLTYKDWDAEHNRQIPKPERPDPPGQAVVFVEGMKIAAAELEMASGQFQAQQNNPNVERTPQAVSARQRQGDVATYHFIDNLALAIRYTGKIIIDLVPHIYDTERVIQILNRDGTQTKVTIDPGAKEAFDEKVDQDIKEVLFNPKVGKYDVESDIGPAWATQRQEAWNAFVQIVTGSPELLNDVGDLMFKSADFPLADEIAVRLRRKIRAASPWLFDDDAPTPQMQQLKSQLEEATQQVAELMEQLAEANLEKKDKSQLRQIEAHEAGSKRITALSNAEPELNRTGQMPELEVLIKQTLAQMLGVGLQDIGNEQQQQPGAEQGNEGGEQPPVEGAQQAPDGHWYLPDPAREGKYLRVDQEERMAA